MLFGRALSIGSKKLGLESYIIHSKMESRNRHVKVLLIHTTFIYTDGGQKDVPPFGGPTTATKNVPDLAY